MVSAHLHCGRHGSLSPRRFAAPGRLRGMLWPSAKGRLAFGLYPRDWRSAEGPRATAASGQPSGAPRVVRGPSRPDRVTLPAAAGVPVSSRRLPQAPQPSSRDTDGLQLASSWTRDEWEFNATARGVDKWLIAHLFAAARSGRCKVSRLRKGPEVRFSCRATKVPRLAVSLAVREVRGDRRLRGADRPIKCGVSCVHVRPPEGAGARRHLR
jgi:hypothetical protein